MADVEVASVPGTSPQEGPKDLANVTVVEDLSVYPGTTTEEKVDSFIEQHAVVVISKTWCPFCIDVKDLFGNVLGVQVHSIETNTHPEGAKIFK